MHPIAPEELIPFAEQLANISGEIIRRYFRKNIMMQVKEDESPVTIADTEAEKSMRAAILSLFPGHGVWGEEFGVTNEGAEYMWVLDPIDGTKSFMIGRPIFGTLIGLLYKKKPILGVIDQPVIGERWLGIKGFATHFNYGSVHVRGCKNLSDAVFCTTSPNLFEGSDLAGFERIRAEAKYTIYGGDCYSYGLLANGMVDVIIETGLKAHDFCALVPVVKGAGGMMTDWEGDEIHLESDGRVVVTGDARVHEQVLKLLKA